MEFFKIDGFDLYEINKCGVVKNRITGKILSQYIGSTGYYMVSLHNKGGHPKPQRVHRLIAKQFIPNPNNYSYVNHIDGNKLNYDIKNLEWCTHLQNMRHAFETGLANNTGVNNGMCKLNDEKAKQIKNLLEKGLSQYKIAEMFNVSRSAILKIKLKKTWNHV
jgi:hypothetical protein